MDSQWILYGLSTDYLTNYLVILFGFSWDSKWILMGFSMDSLWIINGFSMEFSSDSLWILYGFSMDYQKIIN